MATKLNLKEMLTRKNPPVVQPGKYTDVVVKAYEMQTNGEYEYLRITYALPNGYEISENRFPQGLGILISHLRKQLCLQDIEISGEELLEPGKHKFTIWVEEVQLKDKFTNEVTGRATNINFLEPLKKAQPAPAPTPAPASAPAPAPEKSVVDPFTTDDIII